MCATVRAGTRVLTKAAMTHFFSWVAAAERTAMDEHEQPPEGEDLTIAREDVLQEVQDAPGEDAMEEEGGAREGETAGEEMNEEEHFEDNSIAAFYNHRKSVFCVQLHPKFPYPPLALSGGEDDRAWIWNTIDGEPVVELGGHADSVVAVGFSADGDLAATGGLDGHVRVWRRRDDAYTTWEFLTDLEGPSEVVVRTGGGAWAKLTEQWLNWHPRGNVLVAGASDSTVWMWQRTWMAHVARLTRSAVGQCDECVQRAHRLRDVWPVYAGRPPARERER